MTVWYIDPENGNDSNDGQSFANRRKTISSSTSNEDEIRFIKSPDPTSLGSGSWTDSTGTDTLVTSGGVTVGSNTVITNPGDGGPLTAVSASNHPFSTGDVIYIIYAIEEIAGVYSITKVDDTTFTLDGTENHVSFSGSSSGFATIYLASPYVVKLDSSPIKNIICHSGLDGSGDLDWTAVQGTTAREYSNWQSGYKSARKFIPGNTVTGKVAYVQLNSALDLSGYQQISFRYFWDYCLSGQKPDADVFSLRLCSDTSGDTTVHTVPIKPPCGDDTDRWGWYTHDFGTNLNSSIQSIALHAENAMEHASTEIQIDNVIACKAKSSDDSLHLGSVIGKGNTQTSRWHPIMAIVDKVVLIQSNYLQHDGLSDYTRTLNETTETVTTYKRECFTSPDYYSSNEEVHSPWIQNGYLNGKHGLTVSGGWNTTDMSSQDTNSGTWLGLQSSMYVGLSFTYCAHLNISNFGIVRGFRELRIYALSPTSPSVKATISKCAFIGSGSQLMTNNYTLFDNCYFAYGFNLGYTWYTNRSVFVNCTLQAITLSLHNAWWTRFIFANCTIQGQGLKNQAFLRYSGNYNVESQPIEFANCTFKSIELMHNEDWSDHVSANNCTFGNYAELFDGNIDVDSGIPNDDRPNLALINYNDTANDHRLYYTYSLVTSDSSVTQSGSGFSWKYEPLTTNSSYKERSKEFPLSFKLAEVAVTANAQVTVTGYGRRSATGSEDDYIALAALVGENASIGLTSDVIVASSASADTWDQLTLTFTPTITGVATIHALMSVQGMSDNVWIDSLSISQA